jgi:hypothetical protein
MFAVAHTIYNFEWNGISELCREKYLERNGRGLIWRHYPGIRLEGLRKTAKDFRQDNLSPGPRFEPGISWMLSRCVNHSATTFAKSGYKAEQGHMIETAAISCVSDCQSVCFCCTDQSALDYVLALVLDMLQVRALNVCFHVLTWAIGVICIQNIHAGPNRL